MEKKQNTSEQEVKDQNTSVPDDKKYTCHICGSSFKRVVGLQKHIAGIHEEKKPYQCSQCNACFADSSNLKRHFKSAHEGKKPYLCSICGVGFAQNVNLKAHIVKIHEGNKFEPKVLWMKYKR